MLQSPSVLTMLIGFVLVLGPLVVLHEFGHYLVGRLFGVRADAFSVGFGKELIGHTDRRGTRWKLSALPLGGYVQFAGDMNAAGLPAQVDGAHGDAGTFQSKPLWQRALIVLAGPVTNLLVAIAIFAGFNLTYGKLDAPPVVAAFAQGSAAQAAGIKVGDRILAIDGDKVAQFAQVREKVVAYPDHVVRILVQRAEAQVTIPVRIAAHVETDQFGNHGRIGLLGIAAIRPKIVAVGPVEAVTIAGGQSATVLRMMVTGIVQIVGGERSVKELGGPIKIAQYSGQQLSLGMPAFISFAALISINLAFINLLPIPTLDGGHLALYAAEAIRRKPVGQRSQEWAFRTGLALVLALMLFVTFNDLVSLRLFGG